MIHSKQRSATNKLVAAVFRIFALSLLLSLPAHALKMTSGFTGAWFDPDHSGQGFLVEVIDNGEGPEALVFYFTYDLSGNPLWVFGQSPIDGAGATVNLRRAVLSNFDPDGEVGPPEFEDWGTVGLSFSECNDGLADIELVGPESKTRFQSKIQVRSGTLRLRRLSSIIAKPCTGGVSDDISPDLGPGGFTTFIRDDNLFGVINYEARPGRAELTVDLKRADPGTYDVIVGDELRGNITVDGQGVATPLRFTSPANDGALLDFDPVGVSVGLRRAGESAIVVSRELPTTTQSLTDPGFPPPFGDAETAARLRGATTDVKFSNPSPAKNFEAFAALRQLSDAVEFDVQLTGATPARYQVFVDGRLRGELQVDQVGSSDSFGQVRFRFPAEAGRLPLNFDPRGKQIEFRQAGGILADSVGTLLFDLDLPQSGRRVSSIRPKNPAPNRGGR